MQFPLPLFKRYLSFKFRSTCSTLCTRSSLFPLYSGISILILIFLYFCYTDNHFQIVIYLCAWSYTMCISWGKSYHISSLYIPNTILTNNSHLMYVVFCGVFCLFFNEWMSHFYWESVGKEEEKVISACHGWNCWALDGVCSTCCEIYTLLAFSQIEAAVP